MNMNELLKQLINDKEEINEELLQNLINKKIDKFRESFDENELEIYAAYQGFTHDGNYLVSALIDMQIQDQIELIEIITKGYVNSLYTRGELHLNEIEKANIETMFNIVKKYGDNVFLEAALYSLINGAV